MCNVWNMDHSDEMEISEFSQYIQDDLFKEVIAVGINGGEPTLIKNLPEYATEILTLPALKSLNIISNGYKKNTLLKMAEDIYQECCAHNVRFHISISLDGYGAIHDKVRGIQGAFEKTVATIDEIMKNQHLYCDTFDIGCTVINQNVHHLMELEAYAKSKNYNIKYRLGIENKRIESNKLSEQFSVFYNDNKQSAIEFFHYKAQDVKNDYEKFKYFALFHWLSSKEPKRLLGCMWQDEGVTLDSRGNLYYCAVESECLGSLRKEDGESVFFKSDNLQYREWIIENKCDQCIHDYAGKIEEDKRYVYLQERLSQSISMKVYKQRASLL